MAKLTESLCFYLNLIKLGNEKVKKSLSCFRRCRWPPRVDKLAMPPAVYDKQSMYDVHLHWEYSWFLSQK